MSKTVNLNHITIVLHRPRYAENIGAAARAMCNMGINHLIVVNPKDYDLYKVLKLATHAASNVIENSKICADLKDALAPFSYVVGTTARLGGQRRSIRTPSALAQTLIPISVNNQIAILFGPEDRGLSNEDIRLCHELVNIPTAEFSSVNVAQAVMVVCYEIFSAQREADKTFIPRLANRHELDGMYEQLKETLVKISYINAENPDYWMNKLRHFFTRMKLQAKEVSIIRGICRQIDWYGKKRFDEGQKARQPEENI
jgi:tRNA/rRNA methyltransferase